MLLLLLTLRLGWAETGGASSAMSFQRWGRAEGLPDDTVTALLQTRDGYLWVGTGRGLVRFDGVRFEPFTLPGLAADAAAVTSLCEDDSCRLWVGTQNHGLFWAEAGIVHRHRGRLAKPDETVNSLAVDRGEQLWIGTPTGLQRINLQDLTQADSPPGLPDEPIASIHAARSGTVWITTRSGMSQHRDGRILPVEFEAESLGRSPEFIGVYEDRGSNLWAFGDTYLVNLSEGKRFNYFRAGDAASLRIWSLCEGRHGELWIGTSGQGLFAFADGKFRPLTLREGRLPSDVRAICEDREGNLWLGTSGGGLVRLRTRREQVFDVTSGLPDHGPTCLAVDAGGRFWAGYDRSGLYTAVGKRFERTGNPALVGSIGLALDDSVWVGTRGDGLLRLKGAEVVRFTTGSGLASDIVPVVAVGADGAVWAGTGAGTLHRFERGQLETFDRQHGLSGAAMSALLVSPTGRVWAGTVAGELFERTANEFRPVPAAAALAGAEVRALDEDAQARLWIGTAGRGLACLVKNQLSVWDTSAGFPDNDVLGVLSETNGAIWAATSKGVFRLEFASTSEPLLPPPAIRLILENNPAGRETAVRGFPRAVRSPDGRLWFALSDRLVALDPSRDEANPSPLPVYLEKVLANGSPLEIPRDARPILLPGRLDSLEIVFTALNLTEPEKVRFQHKLDGFDGEWIDGGDERRVRYGRLPYGRYTFHLRARSADGVWSSVQPPVTFERVPPAWRSAGAMTAYALGLVGLVVAVVRAVSHRRLRARLERLAQQQAMERERMRIAQDMHDEIGSKLTKISYLSELALRTDRPPAESFNSIATTSRDLLQALDEIVWAVNPRNDSLEHLAAYLGHYATEYLQNTSLELEMEIPDDLPIRPLSAETRHNLFLAFEESLGNALKHSGGSRVQVAMKAADSRFTITVRDNGRGMSLEAEPQPAGPRGRRGNGLANLRQRLADIGGDCRIDSVPGRGTDVSLTIPLPAGHPASE